MDPDGLAPGSRPRRPVLVTGVGSVSPLAVGQGGAVAAALARGTSAIAPIRAFSTGGCPSHVGGEVGDLTSHLGTDEARRLPRVSQLAVVACRLALADGGLEPRALPGLGLVLGSVYGDLRSSQAFAQGFLARGPLALSPLLFPSTVMNGMGAHASIAVGVRGPMVTVNQPGIAGELAIARAAGLITAGRATAVLAGGVDELCGALYREMTRLGLLSPGAPDRSGAEGCWPFDRRANGTVVGEGATVVLLEAAETAEARGARIYAELRGAAWGNLVAPAHGMPVPRRRDPAVIRRALAAARVEPADVDAVYLTGVGAPAQDACELDLITAGLGRGGNGRRRLAPRLTALTPLTGDHAGLGVLRVASAAATLAGERLPGLPDLATPIRGDLEFAGLSPTAPPDVDAVLVHGLARGGGHAALVLGHWRQ